MIVGLRKTGSEASAADIGALEQRIGCKLPETYRDFIRKNDGATPEANIFDVGPSNQCGVNQFIPVAEVPAELNLLACLPSRAFPVAWAECGNYVYLDAAEGGAVFFWDHELDQSMRLADDFDAFLNLLRPFDPASVKLKPGQVKSVWIHPDLARKLREEKP